MDPVTSYLIGVGVVEAGAAAVVLYLRPHLRRILCDLCGTEDRASFWTAFSITVLLLIPAICALAPTPANGTHATTFFDISNQLQAGLLGLVGAVVILGFVLARFIPPRHVRPESR